MSKIFTVFLEQEAMIRRIIARYCPHREDVEELTQETFLRCYAAERNTPVRDPRRFLLRVARNIAVSETRRHRNKTTDYLGDSSALDVHTHDRQITPEKQLDGRQKLALLAKAIASLPEEDQDILLMRKMEHLKFKQIAIRMNLSVSAVQMSRYTDISIEIQGEALAATPVAGYFRTGKVDALLEALELMGGIEIEWIDARHVRLISSDLEQ